MVGVICVSATACSGDDAGSTGTTALSATTTAPTTSTTLATTTTATSAPPTTTLPSVELPEVRLPDTDVEDAGEAFRLIRVFLDDLSRNPQPDLLERYYDPECRTYESVHGRFVGYQERGERFIVPEPTEVLFVGVFQQSDEQAELTTQLRFAADALVNTAGKVIRNDPEAIVEQAWSLSYTDGMGWRLCDFQEVG